MPNCLRPDKCIIRLAYLMNLPLRNVDSDVISTSTSPRIFQTLKMASSLVNDFSICVTSVPFLFSNACSSSCLMILYMPSKINSVYMILFHLFFRVQNSGQHRRERSANALPVCPQIRIKEDDISGLKGGEQKYTQICRWASAGVEPEG